MVPEADTTHERDALLERYDAIEARVSAACARAGRARDEVTLVAVSKTFPAQDLRALYDERGVRVFGESYVQEWQGKASELPDDVRWHFIGHMQSNKCKYLGGQVELVHSVDRGSLVKALAKATEGTQDVLLQVRIGGEDSKSGVEPGEVLEMLERMVARENLCVVGVMTLPPPVAAPEDARVFFRELAAVRETCRGWLEERGLLETHSMEHLSMGMSSDFEVAIEEGATLVRVGSSIFGSRR